MIPVSISEKMMFSTVRLVRKDGTSGTGFFFNYKIGEKIVPVLITNQHVLNDNPKESMTFQLHLCDSQNQEEALDQSFSVTYNTAWMFHSSQDLCFTFVNPLFEEVKRLTGKNVYSVPLAEDIIYDQYKLEGLSALEHVVMVGYPNGLWDTIHNYPLFRNGYTAAHPAYDFNRKSVGVVDMACFEGSSGSPIFILDETGYIEKTSNIFQFKNRLIFLGILFQGPKKVEIGKLGTIDEKMQHKIVSIGKTGLNLGYYIKSYELHEFKEYIKKII